MDWPDPVGALSKPNVAWPLLAGAVLMIVVIAAILGGPKGAPPLVAAPKGAMPTTISIVTPKTGTTVTSPTITLAGTGPPGATVTIGAVQTPQTTVAADGTWTAQITIPPGKDNYDAVARLGTSVSTANLVVTLKPTGP